VSAKNVLVAALAVALVAAGCGSHKHRSSDTAASTTTTTRPASSRAARASTSTAPATTSTTAEPVITLPPPYTTGQLELALLQNGDLPSDSQRAVVAPGGWSGVCGSTGPAFAAPASAAAVEFIGPQGLHVREDLADYVGNAGGYLDAVRAKVSCANYASGGSGGSTNVVAIPPAVVAGGLDPSASGVGVQTVDSTGHRSFHLWVREGNVVISLQDDVPTETAASAVQLAQLALERVQAIA